MGEQMVFLTEGLIIKAEVVDGKLVRMLGEVATVEQIEMNEVRVLRRNGVEDFYTIGDTVKWVPEEGGWGA